MLCSRRFHLYFPKTTRLHGAASESPGRDGARMRTTPHHTTPHPTSTQQPRCWETHPAPRPAVGRKDTCLSPHTPRSGGSGRAVPYWAQPSTCRRGLPAAAEDSRGRRRPGSGPARSSPGAGARAGGGGGGHAPRPSPHEVCVCGGVLTPYPCYAPRPRAEPLHRARRGAPTGEAWRGWAGGGGGGPQLVGPRLPGVKGVGGKWWRLRSPPLPRIINRMPWHVLLSP